jgi:adenylate cyclase
MPTEQKTIRKLRAILSADVKGYSLLMADNELATIATLKSYRQKMTSLIQQHQGRVVDSPGDNILAEFASAVDAVTCAVKIQEELKERNAELSEDRKMQFRIGINIGDIVQDADRIYGDGVNVAARIEGLAEPGGICISRGVCDHVRKKLKLGFKYLGEHSVKNIAQPVRVYKVLMGSEHAGKMIGEERAKPTQWRFAALTSVVALILVVGAFAVWHFYFQPPPIETASIENMAFPLPDKPSIAVLAFENMSEDPKQEYFSDGFSEEIITALSKTDQLFVIARESTFSYKGKQVKVQQVSRELGVKYILEGSVRKTQDRVRITAQLIDAITGHHLWSERYDRDLKDIFALQDEITMQIVTALQVKLTEGEQARMWVKKYKNLNVYLKALEGWSLWRKGTKECYIRFGQLGQEIVDMAPEVSTGYRTLGWHYWYLARVGKSPQESIAKALKLAQKALSLDEFDAFSHSLLGSVYFVMREYEKAIAAGERSIKLDPNGAMVHGLLGLTLSYAGRPDEAIVYIKKGIRLNPFPAYWYFSHLSRCYMLKGQYEDALTAAKKAHHRAPSSPANHIRLAMIYALLDRQEKAEAAVKKALEIRPSYSVERFSKTSSYKNQADLKLFVDAMRKAGFPEHTPSQ